MKVNEVEAIHRVAAGRTVAGRAGGRERRKSERKEPSNNTWKGPLQLMDMARQFWMEVAGKCAPLFL